MASSKRERQRQKSRDALYEEAVARSRGSGSPVPSYARPQDRSSRGSRREFEAYGLPE